MCQLCWSLSGMKPKCALRAVPPKAGEAGCSPRSIFPGEENSFRWRSSLLVLSNAGLGDGVMQAKWNSFSLPFLFVGSFQELLHCVAEASSVASWARSELFLFVHCCLIVVLCRVALWGFLFCPLGDASPLTLFLFISYIMAQESSRSTKREVLHKAIQKEIYFWKETQRDEPRTNCKLCKMSEIDGMAVRTMVLVTIWTRFIYFITICFITGLLSECIDKLSDFLQPFRFLPN